MKKDEKNKEDKLFLFFQCLYGGIYECSVLDCEENSLLHTQIEFKTQKLVKVHTVNSFLCRNHLLQLTEILNEESLINRHGARIKEDPSFYLEESFLEKILGRKGEIQTSFEYFHAGKHTCFFQDCDGAGFLGLRVVMRVDGKVFASFNIPICGKCFLEMINRLVKEEKDHRELTRRYMFSPSVSSNYKQ